MEVRAQSMFCSENDNYVAQILRFTLLVVFVYKCFCALRTGMMEGWNPGIVGNEV
jgi:hypothetical protein